MAKSAETNPEIDELKEDLAAVKKHLSELTDSIKRDGIHQAESLGVKAKERLGELKDHGAQGLEKVEDRVKERPGQSIVIAFAAGFLTSLLMRSRN